MQEKIKYLAADEKVRYLFFGGCTTLVNIGVFTILSAVWNLPIWLANLISIMTAIVFAFFVNKWFVFQSEQSGGVWKEFLSFTAMRGVTLVIEFVGVGALTRYMPAFAGKVLLQIIIIILNYIISKFYVFRV